MYLVLGAYSSSARHKQGRSAPGILQDIQPRRYAPALALVRVWSVFRVERSFGVHDVDVVVVVAVVASERVAVRLVCDENDCWP